MNILVELCEKKPSKAIAAWENFIIDMRTYGHQDKTYCFGCDVDLPDPEEQNL